MDWGNLPSRLEGCGIKPNLLHLHQYFLIDEKALNRIVGIAEIEPQDIVMEIGSGVGNITELLAEQADKVLAYEVDKRFNVFLGSLVKRYPNIIVRLEDIKRVKWPEFDRLVANIPFNTLEPILPKLVQSKVRNVVLVVGNRFRQIVGESLSSDQITKLSVMMHAFFKIDECFLIEKSKFYPEPAMDAIVVELIPIKPKTYFLQFCRSLFENQNKLVEHVLKLYESHCDRRCPQKSKVNLPIDMLNKRADHLSNSDFEKLFLCFA